ncbi:MAG: nitrite/sulfite reductase [Deltaproteobacteria bacterium]|nr:nitrite/sulfite reductase [Deltaproteobacteria bacterium]
MARALTFRHRSEDEEIKEAGLTLDFDELAARGAMSSADASIAKWYGIYRSRHPGFHMARIVLPGGILTAAQARNIAGISERYGQGIVNVTTRQALQLHWLKIGHLPEVLRELRTHGNTTFHGCGDVTRNVAACPLAESCVHRRVDVRPHAKETARVLGSCRDLDNLPRKYKITFSGCSAACGQPHINCCGFIGVLTGRGPGFRVVIGGGMGWKAFVAKPLFGFVPADRGVAVARAVGLLFRDEGDRYDRACSRLKFVVDRLGIDRCRELVLDHLAAEGVDQTGLSADSPEDLGPPPPARPLTEEVPVGTDGLCTVRALVPKGELSFRQLAGLAGISERFGDQRLRASNRQNLEIGGVLPEEAGAAEEEIRALGFETRGSFSLCDIVACVGTTYCPKAVTETRALADRLGPLVSEARYATIRDAGIINITGCPNSCSPYRIADLGFRGMRIREESGSVEAYEVRIGGRQECFGEILGEFKLEDCEEVTRRVLDLFGRERLDGEALADCVARVGIDCFRGEVFHAV